MIKFLFAYDVSSIEAILELFSRNELTNFGVSLKFMNVANEKTFNFRRFWRRKNTFYITNFTYHSQS